MIRIELDEPTLARTRITISPLWETICSLYATYYPDGAPDWLAPFRDEPARAFAELSEELAAYWEAVLAPYWPAMRAAPDEEVLHRARALAAEGPDALLADLHERVRWEKPVLTLVKPLEQAFTAVDQRLVLIPLIFSRGALACSPRDDRRAGRLLSVNIRRRPNPFRRPRGTPRFRMRLKTRSKQKGCAAPTAAEPSGFAPDAGRSRRSAEWTSPRCTASRRGSSDIGSRTCWSWWG
ncbi:MAG TPA: hypothetical protein VFX60_12175 [Micromonospora sp.]|nr:hypothetical protein [Micromonospora sp.]